MQLDLPSDFLQVQVVEKHLGKLIRARQDPTNPRIFFTQAYIQRCKAKIRGALNAITKPTNVATVLQQINVQEKLFHTLFDEISPAGNLTSKQSNAQYVPHIYAKMQVSSYTYRIELGDKKKLIWSFSQIGSFHFINKMVFWNTMPSISLAYRMVNNLFESSCQMKT